MNLISKFWSNISSFGITENVSIPNAKRFKLSNQLISISIILTFFYVFIYSYWDILNAVKIEIVFIFLYTFLLLLAKFGHTNLSKLLFVIILNFHIFSLCLCFGESSQMHLLFIPVSAVSLVLFDYKSKIIIGAFIAFSVFIYLLLFIVDFNSPLKISISTELLHVMRISFNLTAIFSEIVIIYSFISNYDRAEKSLDESNILLEEQFKSIYNTSFDALFLVDYKERKIIKANIRAVELFEMESEMEFFTYYGLDFHKEELTLIQLINIREELAKTGMFSGEILYKTKKGNEFWGSLAVRLILIGGRQYQSVRIADITAQKNVESQIQASLKEKETLLSEIHHRVKNNLAVVSGLLGLQAEYVEDKKAKELFEESRNRIHSMALIHDKLYQHETLAKINFNAYINDLVEHITQSYASTSTDIQFSVTCNDIFLDIKNAIPCGLILNELISNSFKHAFKDQKVGEIKIVCTKMGEKFTMMVSDNGIGYDFENGLKRPQSLGLTLIGALAQQVSGTVKTTFNNGTAYYISFEA